MAHTLATDDGACVDRPSSAPPHRPLGQPRPSTPGHADDVLRVSAVAGAFWHHVRFRGPPRWAHVIGEAFPLTPQAPRAPNSVSLARTRPTRPPCTAPMEGTSFRAARSPWHVLLAGTLLLLALEGAGLFAATTYGGLAAFFIMLFGGAIIAGVASRWLRAWAGIVYGIAFLVVVILGFGDAARPIWQSLIGEQSTALVPVSVEQAHELDASFFQFSDGAVRTALLGHHTTTGYIGTRTGGTGYWAKTQRVVAPLVRETWQPEDPITVWVVCSDTWNARDEVVDTWKCEQNWKQSWRAGARIGLDATPEVDAAIADAVATHDLHSHPRALMVEWSEDAQGARNASQGFGTALLILAHISYAGAVLWHWRRIRSVVLEPDATRRT